MNPCFINILPTHENVFKDVRVSKINREDVKWWELNVQPFIKNYEPYRADANWSWSFLFKMYSVFNRFELYKITTLNEKNEEIILGLLMLDVKAKFFKEKNKSSVFIWYLSNLPYELSEEFKINKFKNLGAALIDVALCVSFRYNYNGIIWLHAVSPNAMAVNKGADLKYFYEKIGMKKHILSSSRINLVRGNDGRYFYHSKKSALLAINKFNNFRR